ncbi:MAG: STAS-like domain-containing protein [Fimbriimonadaceae bacterium]|nr:STAS-like domain-containing protein [Fimbriimonadaceae bacterium]
MCKTVFMAELAGSFAENKDIARSIRIVQVEPALEAGEEVVLDFQGVTGATQSFVHALISEPIRRFGDDVFDRLLFKNCAPVVQEVVRTVADYMLES